MKTAQFALIGITTVLLFCSEIQTLRAAPSIEPCPPDSIEVAGTCKCNPETCAKPPCLSTLSVVKEPSQIPGKCCPIYKCEGCTNDTRIEGKCPCVPGATLNPKGECECRNLYEKLIGDECVCDPDLCELPQLCDDRSVAITIKEGCCTRTKCKQCPDDSFAPQSHNESLIEPKCLCFPCKEKVCGPNETVDIQVKGSGFPGRCCDIYDCKLISESKNCVVSEIVYKDAEKWTTPDSQVCVCRNGIALCDEIQDKDAKPCHVEGHLYKHNETWLDYLDNCIQCTCIDGEKECIAQQCATKEDHVEKPDGFGEKCPPFRCSKLCPDGFKMKKGCPICRCSADRYEEYLRQKYNITRGEWADFINHRNCKPEVATTSTTTTTPTPSIVKVMHQPQSSDYYDQVLGPLVILLLCLLVLSTSANVYFGYKNCKNHKRGSYNTNSVIPSYKPILNNSSDSIMNKK